MTKLTSIQLFAVWVIPVLFAITLHEVAHGWIALKLGDKTAKMLGRLTVNPIKHIDPIGTVLVPAILFFLGGFIFGWAKPVPVTYENLRNPRRDMALVALAGPIANLLMALFWALIGRLGLALINAMPLPGKALLYMGGAGIIINIVIMILNLIPIPPLDGSRIVNSFLTGKASWYYMRIEPYGFFILLALLATGILAKIMGVPILFFVRIIANLFGLPIS